MKDLLLQLSDSIRDCVRPWVLDARGGEVVGEAHSGDATFKIDQIAEQRVNDFLAKEARPIAFFSEDQGLVMPTSGEPEWLLVVDPVDGSRNAKSGFEACVVSIALVKYSERPILAEVTHGLLREIVGDRIFYAEQSGPAEIIVNGETKPPELSSIDSLDFLRWSLTVPGRPASLMFGVMSDLIDASSLTGGFFACNSTCYSISRILTGQQDAYVDIANRIFRDFPETEDIFKKSGHGHVIGFSSYDVAAANLIAKRAGIVITDAYGKPLDDMEILDVSTENIRSCVAASNQLLHSKIMSYIENHIKSFNPLRE